MNSLNERISDLVYHVTTANHAISILRTNKFRLSLQIGDGYITSDSLKGFHPSRMNFAKNKMYSMSTSRSPMGGFALDLINKNKLLVLFQLDGQALNDRYQGNSVEYYSSSSRQSDQTITELEDRIYSNNPTIPNAKKYIMQIHVVLPVDDGRINNMNIKELIFLRKITDIPVFFHYNKGKGKSPFTNDDEIPLGALIKMYKSYDGVRVKYKPSDNDDRSTRNIVKRGLGDYTYKGNLQFVDALVTISSIPPTIENYQNLPKYEKNMILAFDATKKNIDWFSNNLREIVRTVGRGDTLMKIIKDSRVSSYGDFLLYIKHRWEHVVSKINNQ